MNPANRSSSPTVPTRSVASLAWGGSDAAGYVRFEFGGLTHLDRPDLYTRLSPITHAADIHTPMLLLHADDDLRCSPEQADQLYLALRLLGREVEYWRFPDEGHELSRGGSPRHRVAQRRDHPRLLRAPPRRRPARRRLTGPGTDERPVGHPRW